MRSIRETTELLLSIEDRFPVHRILYRGLAVWPQLRLQLLQSACGQSPSVAPTWRDRWRTRRKRRGRRRQRDAVNPIEDARRVIPADAAVAFLEWRSFMCQASGKGTVHRFFDLIREEMGDCGAQAVLRWENAGAPPTVHEPGVICLNRLMSSIHRAINEELLPWQLGSSLFRRLLSYWNRLEGVEPIRLTASLKQFEAVHRLAMVIDQILPPGLRAAFLCCFYSDVSFALSQACRRRGIPCVEVQHGQQGDWHSMYTHWTKFPQGGYPHLPNHFWMWDEAGVRRIDAWGAQARVEAFVGGNPWLIRQIGRMTREMGARREGGPVYLVSLQNFELPEFVWETMDALSSSRWIFRLHPRHAKVGQTVRERCRERLDPSRFEIQEGGVPDIYEVFPEVDYQLTGWSTTAYEALEFQVPTVLIHPNGRDAMAADLASGRFLYADNASDLVAILSRPRERASLESPYRRGRETVREGIARVLGQAS